MATVGAACGADTQMAPQHATKGGVGEWETNKRDERGRPRKRTQTNRNAQRSSQKEKTQSHGRALYALYATRGRLFRPCSLSCWHGTIHGDKQCCHNGIFMVHFWYQRPVLGSNIFQFKPHTRLAVSLGLSEMHYYFSSFNLETRTRTITRGVCDKLLNKKIQFNIYFTYKHGDRDYFTSFSLHSFKYYHAKSRCKKT